MTLQIAATKPSTTNVIRGGKFLTLGLGEEQYGLPILKVREIVAYIDVTPVPCMPPFVKGVINLHGQIISVMDLRSRLGMSEVERTINTCIIVVESRKGSSKTLTGVIVDRVCEVLEIPADDIEDPGQLGNEVASTFMLGIAKVDSTVKILLDTDKVINIAVSAPANISKDSFQGNAQSERNSQ